MDDNKFLSIVKHAYATKKYRPVGVAMIYDKDGRFLIAQSAKGEECWSFPQGGVDPGETIDACIERELREETGIELRRDLSDVRHHVYHDRLPAAPGRKDKRGFTRGKEYFFTLARYVGNGRLSIQRDELRDARWLSYDEALEFFSKGRPRKAVMLTRAIKKARIIIGKKE